MRSGEDGEPRPPGLSRRGPVRNDRSFFLAPVWKEQFSQVCF